MKQLTALWQTMKREWRQLCSRPIYIVTMVAVPVLSGLFFLSLLGEGLPQKVPTAIVDLDNSQMSRNLDRSLNSMELIDVTMHLDNYHDAVDRVRKGEIFGFFLIPDNFERDALSGRTPTLSYYSNLTYFVPGTLSYKGFKTMGVSTSGAIVETMLVSNGVSENTAGTILQPVVFDTHPIGNPWTNYSIYLSNSFIPGVLGLMIMLVTAFSICEEIKRGTSVQWIAGARGSVTTAVVGKLLPQTVIFTIIGFFINALLFKYNHFPLNGHPGNMFLAMFLFVVASQAFAVFICGLVPNLRLALSLCSLTGILAFSIAAFSFPVQSMYGAIGIFSYILPVRWYFLIYVDQALNGIDIYYSRLYYVALLLFPIVAALPLWNLKRHCLKPVYVP